LRDHRYVDGPVFFQPSKQKLLVDGGRDEFMMSVPSLCYWT
jgi:hypothetical protein